MIELENITYISDKRFFSDQRPFAVILSDWVKDDPEAFLKTTLLEDYVSVRDVMDLIKGVKAPSVELIHYLSAIVPEHQVAVAETLRKRGIFAVKAQEPKVFIDDWEGLRLKRLEWLAGQAQQNGTDSESLDVHVEFETLIMGRLEELAEEHQVQISPESLARAVDETLSTEQLFGKKEVDNSFDKNGTAAQLANALFPNDEERYHMCYDLALACWENAGSPALPALAQSLRFIRLSSGQTQKEIAESLPKSEDFVSLYELGKQLPSTETLDVYAKKLAVSTIIFSSMLPEAEKYHWQYFERRMEPLVKRFEGEGLTLEDYYKAFKNPNLSLQSPQTLIRNIEAVQKHFAPHGLTLKNYLRAAMKKASLFSHSPEGVIYNIETVQKHFAPYGLTLEKYLKAAVEQPQLFYQSPETLIGNIERVQEHFAPHGLTLEKYLEAAVKQPMLFTSSPPTIVRHMGFIIGMYEKNLLRLEENNDPNYPLLPVFDYVCRKPIILNHSDSYLSSREIAFALMKVAAGESSLCSSYMTESIGSIQGPLMKKLGHKPGELFLPSGPMPPEGSLEEGEWERRLRLRLAARLGLLTEDSTGTVISKEIDTVKSDDISFISDNRVFAEILSDWVKGDPEGFLKTTSLRGYVSKQDLVDLTHGVKVPSEELTYYLSAIVPEHQIAFAHTFRKHGIAAAKAQKPQVSIANWQDLRLKRLKWFADQASHNQTGAEPLAIHAEFAALITSRLKEVAEDLNVPIVMENLARTLNETLSVEQLLGKKEVPNSLDRNVTAARLANALFPYDEARYQKCHNLALACWENIDSPGLPALVQSLRFIRLSNGQTQKEMAQSLPKSNKASVSLYESGTQLPPAEILDAYAKQVIGSAPILSSMFSEAEEYQWQYFKKRMEPLVRRFGKEGLILEDLYRVFGKKPRLFSLLPETIIHNIETVQRHFSQHGLTLKDYLTAALRQPDLFYRSPETVIHNIETVQQHFALQGLTLKDYLTAAVRQPPLFCSSPPTIVRHMQLIIGMYQKNLLPLEESKDPKYPLRPLFDFVCAKPIVLNFSDEHLSSKKAIFALTKAATGEFSISSSYLIMPIQANQIPLMKNLSHKPGESVPPSGPVPEEGAPEEGEWARCIRIRLATRLGLLTEKQAPLGR